MSEWWWMAMDGICWETFLFPIPPLPFLFFHFVFSLIFSRLRFSHYLFPFIVSRFGVLISCFFFPISPLPFLLSHSLSPTSFFSFIFLFFFCFLFLHRWCAIMRWRFVVGLVMHLGCDMALARWNLVKVPFCCFDSLLRG